MREHIGGVFAGFFCFVLGSVRDLASGLKEEKKSSCCFPLRLAFFENWENGKGRPFPRLAFFEVWSIFYNNVSLMTFSPHFHKLSPIELYLVLTYFISMCAN